LTTLVLRPEFDFPSLASLLDRRGWRRVPDPEAPEPAVPGEPELAAWSRDGARIAYAFHPAIRLRTLSVEDASEHDILSEQLPLLDVETVRALVHGDTVEQVLLGLAAAREAGAVGLLPDVLPRVADEDELIADWATETAVALSGLGLRWAQEALAHEREQHPGRSVLYQGFPRAVRLQILRWWMELGTPPGQGVVEFLSAALDDRDWELRMTALIACGRLGVRELARVARDVPLPDGVRDGVLPEERPLLVAIRELVVASLGGVLPNDVQAGRLGRAVLTGQIDGEDGLARLLTALTVPLATPADPAPVPEGVVRDDESWLLRESGILLIHVPQVPHWLGDSFSAGTLPNPIRRLTPQYDAFLAAEPLDDAVARSLGAETDGAGGMTYPTAVVLCRELSRRSGAEVRIPTADEWEMAARGPDGRRYSGGNVPSEGGRHAVSPWGGRRFAGDLAQWTRTQSDAGFRVACGSPGPAPCAHRNRVEESRRNVGLRIAIEP
jgi:hypothetical protein